MPAPEGPQHSFSHSRRWLNWLNTLLAVAALLALVGMANYLAEGHFKRFQLDRDSAYKLSEQTLRVLDGLTNDVNVTLFFEPHGANEEIYGLTSGLLAEYQEACPRHLHVKTLDYDRKVGEAKEFLAKYSLSGLKEKDFVLFENGGHTRLVYAKDLANYDFSDLIAGRSKYVRRNAFLGELYFTEDIYDVSNPRPMRAYFLYGHGENDPEEAKANNGYSKLAAILKDEVNCDWQKLSLQGTNIIPADCQLLVVAASAREGKMTPDELAKIAAYLQLGGRMLALLTAPSGLETVLNDWGVGVGDSRNRVMETDKNFTLPDGTFLTKNLMPHPIMNVLATDKMPLRMVYPRPVYALENQSKAPGAPDITVLAATSSQAKNEAGQTGTFPLVVAVEQGGIQGVNSPGGRGTRMVVAGDSDFLDDQVIDFVGNHVFAQLALNWLLQRPQIMLSGLGPRPIKEYRLYMTHAQAQTVRWLFLAGLPGGVLFFGGLVWLRRRS
ncbi:MAG: Gldg family protein [Limisphaerales bacterium]